MLSTNLINFLALSNEYYIFNDVKLEKINNKNKYERKNKYEGKNNFYKKLKTKTKTKK